MLESKSDNLRHAQLEQEGHASVKRTREAGYVTKSHKLQAKLVAQHQSLCLLLIQNCPFKDHLMKYLPKCLPDGFLAPSFVSWMVVCEGGVD